MNAEAGKAAYAFVSQAGQGTRHDPKAPKLARRIESTAMSIESTNEQSESRDTLRTEVFALVKESV